MSPPSAEKSLGGLPRSDSGLQGNVSFLLLHGAEHLLYSIIDLVSQTDSGSGGSAIAGCFPSQPGSFGSARGSRMSALRSLVCDGASGAASAVIVTPCEGSARLFLRIEEQPTPTLVASDGATGKLCWYHVLCGTCIGLSSPSHNVIVFLDIRHSCLRSLHLRPLSTSESQPTATVHRAVIVGATCVISDSIGGGIFVSPRQKSRHLRESVGVVLAFRVAAGRLVAQGIVAGAGEVRGDRLLVVMPAFLSGATPSCFVVGEEGSCLLRVLARPTGISESLTGRLAHFPSPCDCRSAQAQNHRIHSPRPCVPLHP